MKKHAFGSYDFLYIQRAMSFRMPVKKIATETQ